MTVYTQLVKAYPEFQADFETGNLSELFGTSLGGGAPDPTIVDGNVTPADVRRGRYAARASLVNPQSRCELVMGNGTDTVLPLRFSEGERWEFSWSFKLSATWNNSNASFQTIAQWFPFPSQNFSGSPPLGLLAGSYLYGSAANLQLVGFTGQPTTTAQQVITLATLASLRGSWTDIAVGLTFSAAAADCRITVDLNGSRVVNNIVPTYPLIAGTGPNGLADQAFFKVGYYRDSAMVSSDNIVIDRVTARRVAA